MNNRTDVALILCNPDMIDLVSFVLLGANLRSCGVEPLEGEDTVKRLICSCCPSVVVFDLYPPYARSTAVLKRLITQFPDLGFVVTCADPSLAVRAAPWLPCHPILQKPYEPVEMRNTVDSMVSRPASIFRGKVAPAEISHA